MQLRSQPWMFPAGVVLQAVGLAVWWEWFNTLAFGTGGPVDSAGGDVAVAARPQASRAVK